MKPHSNNFERESSTKGINPTAVANLEGVFTVTVKIV